MQIGKTLRTLRRAKDLTQDEIQRLTGIKREYISNLERNTISNPTVGTLQKILGVMGIKLSEFFEQVEREAE